MSRKDKQFWESSLLNNATYLFYYRRLMELAISAFEWKNLPETIDERYLELCLFADGKVLFFKNDIDELCALRCAVGGEFDMYRVPKTRFAYAENGFRQECNEDNSVIVYNNILRLPTLPDAELYARRLYDLDRTIDVNTKAQKTPVFISCEENTRLTMENIYQKYEGNAPVIIGDKSLDPRNLQVFQTGAPFVADKVYTLKTQYWNEALTFFGIPNVNITKKERLITDEVDRSQGGTIASRYSKLMMRKQAARKINAMFGTDIDVAYRCENETDSETENFGKDGDDNE